MSFIKKATQGSNNVPTSSGGGPVSAYASIVGLEGANHDTSVLIESTIGSQPGEPAVFSTNRKPTAMNDFPKNFLGTENLEELPLDVNGVSHRGMSEYGSSCFDIAPWWGGNQAPGSGTPIEIDSTTPGKVTETHTLITGHPHTTQNGNIEEGVVYTRNVHNPATPTGFDLYGIRETLNLPAGDQKSYAHYGASVVIGGNKIFVGCPGGKPSGVTVTTLSGGGLGSSERWANANTTTGGAAGCVYVYDKKGVLLSTLSPNNLYSNFSHEGMKFGHSLAWCNGTLYIGAPGFSPDGSVSKYNSGRVYSVPFGIGTNSLTDRANIPNFTLSAQNISLYPYADSPPSLFAPIETVVESGDKYGWCMKVIDDKLFVGSPFAGGGSGAVYMFSSLSRKFIGEIGPPMTLLDTVQGFGNWVEGDGTHLFVGTSNDTNKKIFTYDTVSGIYISYIEPPNTTSTYDGFGRYRSMGRINNNHIIAYNQHAHNIMDDFSISGGANHGTRTHYVAQNCTSREFNIIGYSLNSTGAEYLQIRAGTKPMRPRDIISKSHRWRKYNSTIDIAGVTGLSWQSPQVYSG